MAVDARIRAYYEALRAGDPLGPFFADDPSLVKFGISERLTGYEAIITGLEEQTETTSNWTVDSQELLVGTTENVGWFSDSVRLEWTNVDSGKRFEFDSRWSGTLRRRNGTWLFVGMHVSAPHEIQ